MLNRRTFVSLAALGARRISAAGGRTAVSIHGDAFLINGRPTYAGREYKDSKIEGLLMNSRVVQVSSTIRTRKRANAGGIPIRESGTRSAIRGNSSPPCPPGAPMACLRSQSSAGGSPEVTQGPAMAQQRDRSGRRLRADYMGRLERILNKADELGMVAIVVYFGQDQHVRDEAAVAGAVSNSAHCCWSAIIATR